MAYGFGPRARDHASVESLLFLEETKGGTAGNHMARDGEHSRDIALLSFVTDPFSK